MLRRKRTNSFEYIDNIKKIKDNEKREKELEKERKIEILKKKLLILFLSIFIAILMYYLCTHFLNIFHNYIGIKYCKYICKKLNLNETFSEI